MGTFRWARIAPFAISTALWAALVYAVVVMIRRGH
jgi:hypothetical protein